MADDEAIGSALLLGGRFIRGGGWKWYVDTPDYPIQGPVLGNGSRWHPIERAKQGEGFVSRADISRAWIKWTLTQRGKQGSNNDRAA